MPGPVSQSYEGPDDGRLFANLDHDELTGIMSAMARGIEGVAKKARIEEPRFALVVFNDPDAAQFVSNCDREDVILALRVCADRLEGDRITIRTPSPSTSAMPGPGRD